MHHVDRDTPWDEIWQAMELLVRAGQGALRRQQQLRRLAHRAGAGRGRRARHFLGLVSEQSLYNLNARTIELEVIPACRALRPRRDPVEPARGRPARRRARQIAARAGARAELVPDADREKHRPQLEAWERFCRELGEEPADVALAWLLAQPGGHRADHRPAHDGAARRERCAPSRSSSTTEALKRLDEIWPGPGGEAPEAYAW